MAVIHLDLNARRRLLADWFVRVAGESGLEFGQRGSGGDRFTIGDPRAFHVVADFIEEAPFLRFVASDANRQDLVDDISSRASDHVDAGDFGGLAWYSTVLHEVEFGLSPFSVMGPLLQRLGSPTRIAGWRILLPSRRRKDRLLLSPDPPKSPAST